MNGAGQNGNLFSKRVKIEVKKMHRNFAEIT